MSELPAGARRDFVGAQPALQGRRMLVVDDNATNRRILALQAAKWGMVARDTVDGTEADACWTTEPGVACTIMVADCLPVLLADRAGRVDARGGHVRRHVRVPVRQRAAVRAGVRRRRSAQRVRPAALRRDHP